MRIHSLAAFAFAVAALPAQYTWIQNPANGHAYALTAPMTWHQAEAEAVRLGGHLATVRNAAENAWLAQTFPGANQWIGLTDEVSEGTWRWTSGEVYGYSAWCPGEPNNTADEDYAMMNACSGGRWNDGDPVPLPGIIERIDPIYVGPDWRQINAGTAVPLARRDHAAAWDSSRSRLVMFGGIGQQTFGDTWEWDGTTWLPRLTAVFPPARAVHCAVYDSNRQRVVIYGGRSATGQSLGDTWEWSGTAWTQMLSPASPGPREHFSLTYDPIRQYTVLFGGSDSSGIRHGSTWTWNGIDWTQRSTAGPSARFGHATAYDSYRQRVVLFAGHDGANRDDYWEWDGAMWIAVSQGTRPPARHYHRIDYDPQRRQLVLFGGFDGANRNDTWILGESGWQIASPLQAPSARRHHMMTYDLAGQQMLVFGGFDSTDRNDLWRSGYTASQVAFGTGCGQPPLTLGLGTSPPVVGQIFTAPLTNVPLGAPIAWMSLGLRDDRVGPFLLPLPLDGFGMPGCQAYHDVSITLMLGCTTTGPGTAQFSMQVPNVLSIGGLRTIAQAWVAEPTANAAGLVTSNALRVVFGTP